MSGLDEKGLEAAVVAFHDDFDTGEHPQKRAMRAAITAYLAVLGNGAEPVAYVDEDGKVLVPEHMAEQFRAAIDARPTPPFGKKLLALYLAP